MRAWSSASIRTAIHSFLHSRELAPPLAAGWALRQLRNVLDAAGRHQGETLPPRRLRARTGAPGASQFLDGGREAAEELIAALDRVGRSPAVQSVLDFGCGSGRVLPHVAGRVAPEARCTGCDVDAAAITWAARHRPGMDWLLSGSGPPLPVAESSVELVYSISVFSHLNQRRQDDWLRELARVLAPGGVALLSIHGAHAFEQFRTGAVRSRWCRPEAFDRAPLRGGEFVFEPYRRSRWNAGDLPGVDDDYGLAFHGADYIAERWSAGLEILAVLPQAITGWQDLVLATPRG